MMQVLLCRSKTVDNDQVFRLSGNVISLIRSFLVGFNCAGHVLVSTKCLMTKLVQTRTYKLVFEERLPWHDGLQMGRRIPL